MFLPLRRIKRELEQDMEIIVVGKKRRERKNREENLRRK